MHIQNLAKFYQFIFKILRGSQILKSVMRKMMCNNPNLDLVCIKTYSKCGKILLICSQDIEGKQNLLDFMTQTTLIQYSPPSPISKRGYKTGNNPNLDLVKLFYSSEFLRSKYGFLTLFVKIKYSRNYLIYST